MYYAKLMHWLFGWHYIVAQYGGSKYVLRVHTDCDNRLFAKKFGYNFHIYLDETRNVIPITFPRWWLDVHPPATKKGSMWRIHWADEKEK